MRINQISCDWARALRWFRLRGLAFLGGALEFAPDEGIDHLGIDVVAVVVQDRRYWIPYDALREVRGECQRRANEQALITLNAVVSGWVDNEPVEEDDGAVIYWHSIILRSGQEVAGVIEGVTPSGVRVRTAEKEAVNIPWANVGAAVELLE